ncbi:hypothetical protein SAMN05443252_1119 [Bacillus sp. OV322]|uniref:hypothetical protein n=1 Tax=Bacillus sp. OV322 TaxID=1882764 RepID=UPI0008F1E6F4|nr:hypothetical protein [Bacillus sp. OV322]SFC98395.1 hypothetical protein SAMN05443252_1119 [Bacillus sp. OV322]
MKQKILLKGLGLLAISSEGLVAYWTGPSIKSMLLKDHNTPASSPILPEPLSVIIYFMA